MSTVIALVFLVVFAVPLGILAFYIAILPFALLDFLLRGGRYPDPNEKTEGTKRWEEYEERRKVGLTK